MALTAEMITWLSAHTSYVNTGRLKKRSLSKQMQKFWRRKEKVEEAINELPGDSAGKPALVQQLKAISDPLEAVTDASANDLKAAYRALNQLKTDARTTRDLERGALDPAIMQGSLQTLHDDLSVLVRVKGAVLARVRASFVDVTDAISDLPFVSFEDTVEDALEQYRLLSATVAQLETGLAQAERRAQSETPTLKGSYIDAIGTKKTVADTLASAERNIAIMLQDTPNAATGPLTTLIGQIKAMLTPDDPLNTGPLAGDIRTLVANQREFFLDRKRIILDISSFQTREAEQIVDKPNPNGEDRPTFAKLIEDDEKRLDWARKAMRDASIRDAQEISSESVGWRSGDKYGPGDDMDNYQPLAQFDTAGMLADLNEMPMEHAPDRERVAFVGEAAAALDAEITDLLDDEPYGDTMCDLATKTLADWETDYMRGLSLGGKMADLPPRTKEVVQSMAKNAVKKVADSFPNKCADDLSSMTLNGETYTQVKKLGQGGGGQVFIFVDSNGNEVVLKTPLDEDEGSDFVHADFAQEARNHSQVTGGAEGTADPNVVGMEGIVLNADGIPLIVMELAGGGDLAKQSAINGALVGSGLISEAANQAMIKENLREVVLALKAMEDNHITHFDLKELNVFVSEDGHMKLGDFGLSQTMGHRGGDTENPGQGTSGYLSPEMAGAEAMSSKSDVYSLANVLESMSDPYSKQGRFSTGFAPALEVQGRDESTGEVIEATAYDRLRNAMLEPDPEKRPAMSAILMSSFLEDAGAPNEPEDVEELRAASTAYSIAVGSEVAKIQEDITYVDGKIVNLERDKVGGQGAHMVKLSEQKLLDNSKMLEKFERLLLTLEAGTPEHDDCTRSRDNCLRRKTGNEQDIIDVKANVVVVSEIERAEIQQKIDTFRKELIQMKGDLKAINERPVVAPLIARLDAANAKFK